MGVCPASQATPIRNCFLQPLSPNIIRSSQAPSLPTLARGCPDWTVTSFKGKPDQLTLFPLELLTIIFNWIYIYLSKDLIGNKLESLWIQACQGQAG